MGDLIGFNNHREHRGLREKRHSSVPSVYWYEKKLATNPTNSNELTLPEFVLVRTSSLFFSCSFMGRRFTAYSVVDRLHNAIFFHRKLLSQKERKAQPHKSLKLEGVIRTGTRLPRIARIGTDTIIRVRSSDPFFSVNDINRKISHQRLFYPVIEHGGGAMSMEFERILDASVPARGWKDLMGDGRIAEN